MKSKLKKLGVGIVYLIGSRATGNQRINSDFDFAVVMKDMKKISKGTLEMYNELYDIFSDAIPKIHVDLPFPDNMIELDIVFLHTAPLYYAMEAVQRGKILFETSASFRADFEQKTILEYTDMEPFIRNHGNIILQNL